MRIGQDAIDLVKHFEGLHDGDATTPQIEPYHDPVGYPTIGYGHLLSRVPWEDLSRYPAISVDEAEALLHRDLARFERAVARLCPVDLTQDQFGALVSFAFNVGAGHLEGSTLRKKVRRGEHDEVPAQFRRWVYSRQVKLRGLVRRRAAEAELYVRGTV